MLLIVTLSKHPMYQETGLSFLAAVGNGPSEGMVPWLKGLKTGAGQEKISYENS